MKLTPYEQEMLDGKHGRFKQVALDKTVQYAKALGAEELCVVTKATVYMGAHPFMDGVGSDDFETVFSRMHLCTEENVPVEQFAPCCFSQTCVAPCDQYEWEPLHLTKDFFDKNQRYLDIVREAGVSITGSCTPYLIGWIPLKGEHYVTTESSNVLMCNSVFAACGNSDGIEAATWSSICGRTPLWGNHDMNNRRGTVVFNIECPSETITDWDVLGYTIGRLLPPHEIPVMNTGFQKPNLIKLKQCFATMATPSGAELCHIVDFTPEAPTLEAALGGQKPKDVITVTQAEFDRSLEMLGDKGPGKVDYVILGCPHYSLEEIRDAALYMKGKRLAAGVELAVWTDYAIKEMANVNGYTKMIEEAGGRILTSGCPLVMSSKTFGHAQGIAADGGKQAHYLHSETKAPVYYGDMRRCVDAAVVGKWS